VQVSPFCAHWQGELESRKATKQDASSFVVDKASQSHHFQVGKLGIPICISQVLTFQKKTRRLCTKLRSTSQHQSEPFAKHHFKLPIRSGFAERRHAAKG